MKSRFIVFPEAGRVEMREEVIGPPGPGEIVCAAQRSLISIGTELSCLRGVFDQGTNWDAWVRYPFRPGYSMAAQVAAVGRNVTGVNEGDRVASWTPHQRFYKTLPEKVYPIPDALSDDDATWMCLATTTQLAVRRAEHTLGETVGVVGMGMLGQLVVQYVALSGARKIVAIDAVQRRLDLARDYGATHTLSLDVTKAGDAIAEITGGRMLDVVYDVTGHPAVLASCIQLVRKLGRVILVGDSPTPTQQSLGPGVVSNSVAILGIHGSLTPDNPSVFNQWTRREVIALFYDYLLQGRMEVAHLVTHRHSPANAPGVYAGLVEDRASHLGVIFDWSQE